MSVDRRAIAERIRDRHAQVGEIVAARVRIGAWRKTRRAQ